MRKIILASTSPRRKGLFEKLNLEFEVDSSNYKEDMNLEMPPFDLSESLKQFGLSIL
ncbi:MAG: Maf family protein [Candidatus Portnoybacteria bacterium]|nr:Maf family protein [Candidatus Portnoybacteria bacterium]